MRQLPLLFIPILAATLALAAPKPGEADYPAASPSARHAVKVAAVKAGDYDLVLIGDSITHTIGELGGKYEPPKAVWEKHFAPRRARFRQDNKSFAGQVGRRFETNQNASGVHSNVPPYLGFGPEWKVGPGHLAQMPLQILRRFHDRPRGVLRHRHDSVCFSFNGQFEGGGSSRSRARPEQGQGE